MTDTPQVSELDMLKDRAKLMGITHSNNIGVEALRKKINDRLEGKTDEPETDSSDGADEPNPLGDTLPDRPETPQEMRDRLYKENMRLIRCRIQNLDPKKKDLPGEIFCVGNEMLGTVRKFVPYGEVTDNGYHLPYILYQELNSRRFLNIRTSKKAGQIQVHQNWAKEFAIEVLPPLTEDELKRLANAQAAGNNIDNELPA